MSPDPETAIHLVVRFANDFGAADTIGQHQEVLSQRGSVWFAKFGKKTLGMVHVQRLKDQIREGISTYAYFVGGRRSGGKWYQASLIEVTHFRPDDALHVPAYYEHSYSVNSARLWLKANAIAEVDPEVARLLVVKSSGFPISETMSRSMAPMFIVVDRRSLAGATVQK